MSRSISSKEIEENREDFLKEIKRIKKQNIILIEFLDNNMRRLTTINQLYNNKEINKIFTPTQYLIKYQEYHEKIKLQNVKELQRINHYISQEIIEILKNIETLTIDNKEMEKALEIITMYIVKIKSELAGKVSNYSLNAKYSELQKALEEDKKNGYKWLYSTPIEEDVKNMKIESEGNYKYTGPILRYYTSFGKPAVAPLKKFYIKDGEVCEVNFTEIELNNYKKRLSEYNYVTSHNADKYYPERFKKTIGDKIERIDYLWRRRIREDGSETDGYSGITVSEGKNVMINMAGNQMVSDDNLVFTEENNLPDNDRSDCSGVTWRVKTMSHELGHVYDYSIEGNYSSSKEWKDLYKQIHNEKNSELLDIDLYDSKGNEMEIEWFGRCVDQYIYYPNSKEANIEVTFRGESTTLKDAMGIILS